MIWKIDENSGKLVCAQCGKTAIFPDFIRPEVYGWCYIPTEEPYWICPKCDPLPPKEDKK